MPKHEQWSDEQRRYYKENRASVDRNALINLTKMLMEYDNRGYSCPGDYLSDFLLRQVREADCGFVGDKASPTLAHFQRKMKARKEEGKRK